MKKIIILLIFINGITAGATNYYVKASGSDAASGTSPAAAWQSCSKVTSVWAAGTFAPGDSILFNRGDSFLGTLRITEAGSNRNPIVIAAYGTGAIPVITGLQTVTGWTNLGSNIWESSATNCKTTLNMVTVNGVMVAKGRYPNANAANGGYLAFESCSGTTSITDNQLTNSPNWTGATLVIRVNKWTVQTKTIINHTNTVLTYSGGSTKPQYTSGLGYFIEDDLKTLDSQNEWFLDKATKKLSVYSRSNPGTSIKASIYDTLVKCSNKGYITITNLRFEGANLVTMYITDSPGTQVLNCEIDGSGCRGIWAFTNDNFKAEGNTINHTNSNALYLSNLNASIKNNVIKNTGLLPGMASQGTYHAIHLAATPTGTVIQYNAIDSIGSDGMFIMGNNVIVKNNLINHFGLTTDDCGGIYTAGTSYSGREISGNIILNGWGNLNGEPSTVLKSACQGIYIDEPCTGVYVSGNTVANCRASGLKLHNAYSITARNNTFYNNNVQVHILKSNINASYSRNLTLNNNILFAASSSQLAFQVYYSVNEDPLLFGSTDSNYYCRPVYADNTIQTIQVSTKLDYSLDGWKTALGADIHSEAAPFTLTSVHDILFDYNATTGTKTLQFYGYRYYDSRGIAYTNSITLQPYQSTILLRDVSYMPSGGLLKK